MFKALLRGGARTHVLPGYGQVMNLPIYRES